MQGLRAQNKFVVITLGGRAVTASSLSFIFTSISIWREVVGGGQLDKYRPNRRCHMPHFLPKSEGIKGFSFFFPPSLGNVSPQKNVSRKFHREKITNTGSVSCVCGHSAVGSRWTSRRIDCLCRARSPSSALFTGSSYQPSLHCRPAKPFTISPLTLTRVKANKSKSRLRVFTLQTFTWGSWTQIRSFYTPCSQYRGGNLFKQTRHPALNAYRSRVMWEIWCFTLVPQVRI